MPCTDFRVPTDTVTLTACIDRVREVSYRAVRTDMNSTANALTRIQYLETHLPAPGWWRTWYWKNDRGEVDATVCFQRMKHLGGNFAFCIGFKETLLPEPNAANADDAYRAFLDQMTGSGNDDNLLHFFVRNCLGMQTIYTVELRAGHPDRNTFYDRKRDKLLDVAKHYFSAASNHPKWLLTAGAATNHRHWGGLGGRFFQLTAK